MTTTSRAAFAAALVLTSGLGLAACTAAESPQATTPASQGTQNTGDVGNTDTTTGTAADPDVEASYSFIDLAVPSVGRPSVIASADSPFVIEFPENVRELLPESDRPVLQSYTLTPHTLAPGLCVLNVVPTPHPDGPGLEGLYGGTIDIDGTIVEGTAADGASIYGAAVELVDKLPSDGDLKDAVSGETGDVSMTYALDDLSEAVIVKTCSASTDDRFTRLSFWNGGVEYITDAQPADDLFDDVTLEHLAGSAAVSLFEDGLTTIIDSTLYDVETDVLGEWVYAPEE